MSYKISARILSIFLVVLLYCNVSTATNNFHVRLQATDTELEVNEEVTFDILGMADGAEGLNGINGWNMELYIEPTDHDIISVVDVVFVEPLNPFQSGYTSLNNPVGGEIDMLGCYVLGSQDSETGVGGEYDVLAQVTIKGVAPGVATYDVGGVPAIFNCWLRDSAMGEELPGLFDPDNSDIIFTVSLPEPTSIALLLGGLSLVMRRQRYKRGS